MFRLSARTFGGDVDIERAQQFAAHFGADVARNSLDDLKDYDIDAVILAVGPQQHPDLTCRALAAGWHVWMEKHVAVGFKKVFMPGLNLMKIFLDSGEFGELRTIQRRFPMDIPADGPAVLREARFTNWLGNGVHPLSVLAYLGGRPERLTVHRASQGGGMAVLDFASGAVGGLHLAEGHSWSGYVRVDLKWMSR